LTPEQTLLAPAAVQLLHSSSLHVFPGVPVAEQLFGFAPVQLLEFVLVQAFDPVPVQLFCGAAREQLWSVPPSHVFVLPPELHVLPAAAVAQQAPRT